MQLADAAIFECIEKHCPDGMDSPHHRRLRTCLMMAFRHYHDMARHYYSGVASK